MSDAANVKVTLGQALAALDAIEREGATLVPGDLAALLALARTVLRRQALLLDAAWIYLVGQGGDAPMARNLIREIALILPDAVKLEAIRDIVGVPERPVPGPTPFTAPPDDPPWYR